MSKPTLRPARTFTTARVQGGEIVRLALHRERLLRDIGGPQVEPALLEAQLKAAELRDGMVRVEVTRHGFSVQAGPARRLQWRPGQRMFHLRCVPELREVEGLFVKTTCRPQVEGEVVFTGATGVREGSWFSVAAKVGGRWRTPPLQEGVIFGTTRAALLPLLEERPIADLSTCEAAIAMSALLGVAPIASVDGRSLPVDSEAWVRFRAVLG